jgi:hypothetical protein
MEARLGDALDQPVDRLSGKVAAGNSGPIACVNPQFASISGIPGSLAGTSITACTVHGISTPRERVI